VGHSRSAGGGTAARHEPVAADDRPFLEFRKFLLNALRILSLHRWAFFIPFCLASSIVFVASLYSPRTYTASTSFERRTDPIAMDLEDPAGMPAFTFFRATMVDDLKSEEYMVEVVDNLGLTEGFARDAEGNLTQDSLQRRATLARSLSNRLWIWTNTPDNYVDQVEITYTGPDPNIGRRLVDEVKKNFIRRTRGWVRDRLVARRAYFAEQLAEAEQERDHARREETRLRLETRLVDPMQPEDITKELSRLERENRALVLRKREHFADLTGQQQVLAMLDVETVGGVGPNELEDPSKAGAAVSPESFRLREEIRKTDLEIERLRATRGMTLLHPEIVKLTELRREIAEELARRRGSERPAADGAQPAKAVASMATLPQQWQINRAQTLVRITALEEKIKDIDSELISKEAARKELLEIKSSIYQKQEEYAEVFDRASKARQRCSQLAARLAMIDPVVEAAQQDRLIHFIEGPQARGSSIPISPRGRDILILSLLIALGVGIACVVLAEVLDHVYRSSSQVARSLGLPILEAIDEIVTAQDRRRRLVRTVVITPLILALGLALTGGTGSMAYLSVTRPSTYAKIREIPKTAYEFFAGNAGADHRAPTPADVS
jgi:hypothetical protein